MPEGALQVTHTDKRVKQSKKSLLLNYFTPKMYALHSLETSVVFPTDTASHSSAHQLDNVKCVFRNVTSVK